MHKQKKVQSNPIINQYHQNRYDSINFIDVNYKRLIYKSVTLKTNVNYKIFLPFLAKAFAIKSFE